MEEERNPVWSVTEVNRAVREIVEGSLRPFWVGGEVGSLTLHRSGHAYFSIKDANSQLRVCYFGGARNCAAAGVRNGSQVELFGNLTVYEARGEYQFNVRQGSGSPGSEISSAGSKNSSASWPRKGCSILRGNARSPCCRGGSAW